MTAWPATTEYAGSSAHLTELLAAIAAGQQDALAQLYHLTRTAVYGLSLSYLKNTHDAQDITQDVFVHVWDHAPQYRPTGSPMGWLLTVCRNLCLMRLRRTERHAVLSEAEWDAIPQQETGLTTEERTLLQHVLSRLGEEERRIVLLHAVTGLKHREIAALLCAGPEQVEIREGDSPLDFQLCARGPGGTCEPLPWQELLLFTPFQPETEHPYGVSLLRSMPFLTDILLKIYQATGMNWERMGNVRFAVICRPGEGEGAYAQERCRQIAGEWSAAMQAGKQGAVRDFVAVGDLGIKVIGADNQVLDSQVPVRQILEQLVARTGIPPFLLGLSWSSTERMSAQQADLMTSEITALRRTLEPAVERICEMWLRLHGWGGDVTVDWADINLQDFVEEARAKLYLAQAEAIREEERT